MASALVIPSRFMSVSITLCEDMLLCNPFTGLNQLVNITLLHGDCAKVGGGGLWQSFWSGVRWFPSEGPHCCATSLLVQVPWIC